MTYPVTKESNAQLYGRLTNWKFAQARQYLDKESEETRSLVLALAEAFGDPGWGMGGAMATIVSAAVESLIGPQPE